MSNYKNKKMACLFGPAKRSLWLLVFYSLSDERRSSSISLSIFVVLSILCIPSKAYAYLDPGTGSIMIVPTNNTNLMQPNMRTFMQMDKVQKQTLSLLSLSGWYSSLRGPLPFALGMTLPEDYIVYSLTSASLHFDLGNIFFSQKKFKDAISHYKGAVKIKPEYAAAHNNLGNALVQEGKIKEAITHYRKALSISPDLISARKNLEMARMHREAGETK